MRAEVYFDVLCPWCYIGKRRLTAALRGAPGAELLWRSRELDPEGSSVPGPTAAEVISAHQPDRAQAAARVARIQVLGAAEGLTLNLDKARPVNSFDAHRLVQLAASCGLADQVLERLMHGYHTEGRNIADPDVLQTLATEAGLDPTQTGKLLHSDAFADAVRADERRADERGIRGVPTLVVETGIRASAIQDVAALTRLLRGER
ncbi:DsbA family oxidoreductase [Amycolatopsis granulosa]|uniref:DsbA family oxidoreductase n=1 Tax=Amycolatopsis granulosa TaxID=185684 RepID=UPI00142304D2|nr:DsbA family oxidoreductase [Amycolatopsis granulosa]NIH83504.1 putative DsbA family dithiol-disulfide isomerase [Amycolatopsis granulosa]